MNVGNLTRSYEIGGQYPIAIVHNDRIGSPFSLCNCSSSIGQLSIAAVALLLIRVSFMASVGRPRQTRELNG
ncbi:hypothetical protein ABIF31_009427 [Bradyrhizobium elkanii]